MARRSPSGRTHLLGQREEIRERQLAEDRCQSGGESGWTAAGARSGSDTVRRIGASLFARQDGAHDTQMARRRAQQQQEERRRGGCCFSPSAQSAMPGPRLPTSGFFFFGGWAAGLAAGLRRRCGMLRASRKDGGERSSFCSFWSGQDAGNLSLAGIRFVGRRERVECVCAGRVRGWLRNRGGRGASGRGGTAACFRAGSHGHTLRRAPRKPPADHRPSLRYTRSRALAELPSRPPGVRAGARRGDCVSPRVRRGAVADVHVCAAAAGRFRAADEENLIVARSTSLEVYAMRCPEGDGSGRPAGADAVGGERNDSKATLQCVGRYELYGHAEAMVLMRPQGKDRDVLILVFRDAKLSVVEYNPAADELSTIAIFMFEDEELKRGRVSWPTPPLLRVDPRRRCIALLVYESKLIIIPIRHAGEGDLDDDLAQDDMLVPPNKKFKGENAIAQGLTRLGAAPPDSTGLGFMPSYLIDLDEAADLHGAKGIRGVADFTFLEGYYEPTICLLHENKRTWVGRLAVSHHTKMITTISLNMSQKRHPCIWGASRIPHDCRHLVPLPAPAGGVVVVSSTAVFYRNHGQV